MANAIDSQILSAHFVEVWAGYRGCYGLFISFLGVTLKRYPGAMAIVPFIQQTLLINQVPPIKVGVR
jgi:hypothetical protein